MSFGHNCRFQSSQCNVQEITEFLLNIFASFFVQPLFCALNWHISWKIWFIYLNVCCCNGYNCCWVNGFSGCKNRVSHHKFKLVARNNGWTKKEVNISKDDFPNITLAGLESAIVTKRHLVSTLLCDCRYILTSIFRTKWKIFCDL